MLSCVDVQLPVHNQFDKVDGILDTIAQILVYYIIYRDSLNSVNAYEIIRNVNLIHKYLINQLLVSAIWPFVHNS